MQWTRLSRNFPNLSSTDGCAGVSQCAHHVGLCFQCVDTAHLFNLPVEQGDNYHMVTLTGNLLTEFCVCGSSLSHTSAAVQRTSSLTVVSWMPTSEGNCLLNPREVDAAVLPCRDYMEVMSSQKQDIVPSLVCLRRIKGGVAAILPHSPITQGFYTQVILKRLKFDCEKGKHLNNFFV